MSEFADEYDGGEEFYEPEATPPQGGLVGFARDFVATNDSAQQDLDALSRSHEILSEEYVQADPGDVYEDTSDEYDDGEQDSGLDPFADNFESRVGDYVDQRLASMQVVDPYTRAAYAAERDARRQAIEQEQQNAGLARAVELATPHLENHDARHAPLESVLAGAELVLNQWGVTPETTAGLADWEKEQLADAAIAEAARVAGDVAVTQAALGNVFGRGGRR